MKEKASHKKITTEKVVLTSFFVDVSDVILNTVVALMSGSVVMMSQALEGSADLLASFFLILGITQSKRPSDRKHPLGYGRELYFWTFLSALVTFVITSGVSFYIGLQRFLSPEPIEHIELTIFILLFAVVTNAYSATLSFKRLIGKAAFNKIIEAFSHSALIATKTTFVLDLMGTLASIFGLIAIILYKITGNYKYDGIGAMVIGLVLAVLALFIIKAAKDLLVGQSASPEVEKRIVNATVRDKNVKRVLLLQTLHIGRGKLLVNMEINLADELTTDEIEVLIDNIEKEIKKVEPSATDIHIELESPNA